MPRTTTHLEAAQHPLVGLAHTFAEGEPSRVAADGESEAATASPSRDAAEPTPSARTPRKRRAKPRLRPETEALHTAWGKRWGQIAAEAAHDVERNRA